MVSNFSFANWHMSVRDLKKHVFSNFQRTIWVIFMLNLVPWGQAKLILKGICIKISELSIDNNPGTLLGIENF